jgi:hypothetical protein
MITYPYPSPSSTRERERGYILLLAVLISSVILAISFGVYSIGLKQFLLSSFLKESQQALSAADRGIECFMYWDALFRDTNPRYDTSGDQTRVPTIFLSLSTENLPTNAGVARCSGIQLVAPAPAPAAWTTQADVLDDIVPTPNMQTKFNLQFSDNSCVSVSVTRNPSVTRVLSIGYSDCNPNNPRRAERTIEAIASF